MVTSVKTNFTAGQVSKNLYGRGDLSIFENGARTLENVSIHPTGGVSRRFGTKYVDEVDSVCRVIPFAFNSDQTYLLCFYNYKLNIYKNDELVQTIDSPWSEKQIFEMDWTQSADILLVVHKDVAPKKLIRKSDNDWQIEDWVFYQAGNGMICCPYYSFHNYTEPLDITYYDTGKGTIVSRNKVFKPEMLYTNIRINGGLIRLYYIDGAGEVASFVVISQLITTVGTTVNWATEAFSEERGWPATITFHQDRLVIGGSRSLPNRLWFSQSSDIFNFYTGQGLDTEAIEFSILSDQVNAISAVVSSRHLLVFTTGNEWMVSGDIITPSTIRLKLQTNVGSYPKRNIHPQLVDGATVFISRNGKQLREFLYTDVEEAYQATNLTLMADDIIEKPTDMTFDANSNILYITSEDGTISCLTSYRTEQVNAWSRMSTKGKFLSLCAVEENLYFCVERNGRFFIERSDNDLFLDCGTKIYSETAKKEWDNLDYLEGQEITVVADGFFAGYHKVIDGKITLLDEANKVFVGYSYEHVIEPLPYVAESSKPYPPKAYRMISGSFRLLNTNSFYIDLGNGYFSVPLRRISENKLLDAPPVNFSGDIQLRSLGWVRNMEDTAWSIRSEEPSAFTLLSVLSEIKTKD